MAGTDDVKIIEGVIQSYLDGLYESDAGKIASVFHPTSALTSVTDDGELVITPRDAWLDKVRARQSPQQLGLPRHDQVLTIDLVSPTMAYVKLKCAIPPRFFTDQLSLLKIDGRWQIAQKVFMTEMRNNDIAVHSGGRAMGVIDDYLVDPKVSLLDKTRMQAQVLVPVLRALRAELGNDKADAIVKQALRDWSKQLFAAIGDGIEGSPRHKWAAIQRPWGEVSGKEVEVKILRHDKEALDIDVTRCRFAEFFRALGEPDLGALLICETDFDIASVGKGEVSLERAQTIMRGAPCCTFRYTFTPR